MSKRNPNRSDLGLLVREYRIPLAAMRSRIIVASVIYIIYAAFFLKVSSLRYQRINSMLFLVVLLGFVLFILYCMYRDKSVRVYENGIERCSYLLKSQCLLWKTIVGYRYAFMNDYVFLIEQETKREFKLHQSIFSSSKFINEVERFISHKWVKVGL